MSEEKVKKPFWKKWWVWVIAIVIIGAIATSGNDESVPTAEPTKETQQDQPDTNTEEVNEEETVEETTAVEAPSVKTYGSGSYIVGTDIEPGLYKSEGDVFYWARLSGFSGGLDAIIANGNPMSSSTIVEIKETDKGFESQGNGHWYKIEDDYQGEMLAEFGDGTYIVGKDIAPGTYRSDGNVEIIGYWARLKDFSGELDGIITNGNPDGSVVVEISATDVGFQTQGSGTWTKID